MSDPRPTPPVRRRLADPARLEALRASRLLDQPVDEALGRVTRLASQLLAAPVSFVSAIDDRRHVFAASEGFTAEPYASRREIPLTHSLCRHVVERGAPLRIEDARADALLAGEPAVEELGVVAYLGVPLRDPDGQLLGTVCALDARPRAWSTADEAALVDLGAMVTDVLRMRAAQREVQRLADSLREESRTDPLTGLGNRRRWDETLPRELARARRDRRPLSVVALDLDAFKAYNDSRGHAAGDALLQHVATSWVRELRATDLLVRTGGDEFWALLHDADRLDAHRIARRLVRSVADHTRASAGVAGWDGTEDAERLLARADAQLYRVKRRASAGRGPAATTG